MKRIVIASKNPVKIKATLSGFQKMFRGEQFEIEGVSVPSLVRNQPKSDAETFSGALNRADNVGKEYAEADFWVGIEGGIEEKNSETEAFAWVVIKAGDGGIGKARTGTFFLPTQIAKLIKEGMELGGADDIVFGRMNSKQENGAVGILTGDVIDRTKYYTEAVILALIPFKNKKLYDYGKAANQTKTSST